MREPPGGAKVAKGRSEGGTIGTSHRRYRGGIALAMVLLAGACIGRFRQPEVRLSGVRLGGIGLSGGLVHAQIVVLNPNGFALGATSLEYDLELADPAGDGWIPLASGSTDRALRVLARDSAVFEVPVEFRYDGLGAALRSVIARGTVDYRMHGLVRVEEPVRRAVPYRRSGTVSLSRER